MDARSTSSPRDIGAALRGPNRCDACLTGPARAALDVVAARHPGIALAEAGWCDACGGAAPVVDLPLLLSLSRRGLIGAGARPGRPQIRLRARDWFAPEKKPLTIPGIVAVLSGPAEGGIEAVLAIGRR
jgi:hypothetical protein